MSLICIYYFRSEHSLFELLIEEKSSETKNKRFVHDFKTLADVLVQELVKYDLSRQVRAGLITMRIVRGRDWSVVLVARAFY